MGRNDHSAVTTLFVAIGIVAFILFFSIYAVPPIIHFVNSVEAFVFSRKFLMGMFVELILLVVVLLSIWGIRHKR